VENQGQVDRVEDIFARLTTCEQARDLSVEEREGASAAEGRVQMTLVYGEFGPEAVVVVFDKFREFGMEEAAPASFLDVGSGTGKVLIAASLLGHYTSVVGVEILESLHAAALENIAVYQKGPGKPVPGAVVRSICGDALSRITYAEQQLPLEGFMFVFCNATMFDRAMMASLGKLPFEPGTLCCTSTNKLDDARWEEVDSWSHDGGNWGGRTTFFMFKKRTKRETFIRLTAKTMSNTR
jgi:SAM-dependent methyltransferase